MSTPLVLGISIHGSLRSAENSTSHGQADQRDVRDMSLVDSYKEASLGVARTNVIAKWLMMMTKMK
jgi:hypothetical protein